MIANLLYIIPMTTSQSLFAESSYSERELKVKLKKAIKLIILVNFIGASVIFSLSTLLVRQNLVGIGVAWTIGQGTVALVYLVLIKRLL